MQTSPVGTQHDCSLSGSPTSAGWWEPGLRARYVLEMTSVLRALHHAAERLDRRVRPR